MFGEYCVIKYYMVMHYILNVWAILCHKILHDNELYFECLGNIVS